MGYTGKFDDTAELISRRRLRQLEVELLKVDKLIQSNVCQREKQRTVFKKRTPRMLVLRKAVDMTETGEG